MLEEGLEDDSLVFKGGTLEMQQEGCKSNKDANIEDDQNKNTNVNNNRIWNGISPIISIPKKISDSLWSCKDGVDDQVRNGTSTQVVPVLATESPSDYFTFRDGVIEKAIMECIDLIVKPDTHGDVVGKFLLTEISLWDVEKERLVIITSNYLLSIKYDFIALKMVSFRQVPLETVDTIVCGDLIYPSGSLVPRLNGFASGITDVMKTGLLHSQLHRILQPRERNVRGVRIMWNKGEPVSFRQKWNPFSSDVPFLTFTSHPLSMYVENLPEDRRQLYSCDDFSRCVVELTDRFNSNCVVHHKQIVLQTYVGIGSLIHNKNSLGFFKVRGKFSF